MTRDIPSPMDQVNHFEANLQLCKPALFDLASQIITALPERQWDVLVGDDKGGRLPTRFIRKVLASYGSEPQTSYITGGRNAREATSSEVFKARAAQIGQLGGRSLIVSESNNTHTTARFLEGLLSPYFENVDYAVIVSRDDCSEVGDETFVGGYDKELVNAVYDTFENPLSGISATGTAYLGLRRIVGSFLPKDIKSRLLTNKGLRYDPNSSALTGLIENPGFAYASRVENSNFGVSNYCYARMDSLALEFMETSKTITTPANEITTSV